MNIKNRLRHIAYLSAKDRDTGRTTVTARAAKELDGIVLANTHMEARNIAKQHGVVSKSIEMNLEGFLGPFFVDHHALETLLNKAANKIESLEKKNERMIAKVQNLLNALNEDDEAVKPEEPEYPRSGAV